MIVIWDVDGTVVAQTPDFPIHKVENRTLRPYAKEVIQTLEELGIENYVWSRAGQGNACEAAHRLGIVASRCFAKPEFATPEDLKGIPVTPDLVIDDNEDESILVYPHLLVSTYKGETEDEDEELLDLIPKIREHFDAVESQDFLGEVKVKFRRKRRVPARVRLQRKKYYRKHRSKYKRYRRRYRKRPRAKRIQKIRKRLTKRFGRKLKKFRMRVTV